MKKFMKEHGITFLVDMCVILFVEMALDYLKIENMWIEIGVLVIALLLADVIRQLTQKG